MKRKKLFFYGLNSSSEIDYHFKWDSQVNVNALQKAYEELHGYGDEFREYLKITVCHHPVTGRDKMKNTAFLKQLSDEGFKLFMHGHVHKADAQRFCSLQKGIHTIGAGTFGVPSEGLQTATPWQYNFILYDQENRTITVNTRKRTDLEGSWEPHHLWGNEPLHKAAKYNILFS